MGADTGTARQDRPTVDAAGPLVRPYLLAHEQEERQRERRNALALALYGLDVGPWAIHGHTIGTRAMGMGVAC
ncbi:MAG TPA: hypothetical protein DEQ61_07715 [Streptomyces sp.]|nr:hypothetical protein [Streptomyces sp.]